ncbi:response regulator transcription factor [Micromonospora sp. AMSO31t]|uniref:response regulator transcription factor n=1 Tax=Micromonospora sp. AMSO31t TaxID=2650566 RepID=UPI00124B3BB3|nr:response regulator [Micromonospora sp. AMSO31t]KAB1913585.1 response regulator [Micromonospora sp. AMSO31t]
MTLEIRGLLVDDDPSNTPIIRDSMDLEFEDIGMKVAWAVSSDATSARKAIRDNPPFDFAIVDYGLGEGQQSGIAVVEAIRARGGQTHVLVITGLGNKYPNFRDEALRAGADEAVIRFILNMGRQGGMTFRALANNIRLHLARKRDFEGLKVVFTDDDLALESTLHSIGSPNPPGMDSVAIGKSIVRSLAIDCLAPDYRPDATTLAVGYLAPGRSGAHVCQVDHMEGRAVTSYVLKIGLDRRALEFELQANKRALHLLGTGDLVGFSGQIRTHQKSGYHAVAARLATGAVTLAEWLAGPADREAAGVADILFGAQLTKLFAPGQRDTRSFGEWLVATPVLRLRVRDTLNLYEEILTAEWEKLGQTTDGAECVEILTAFVDHGALPGGRKPEGKTTFIDAFGDLHSTNVLVYPSPDCRPVLVDASMYGPNHWAVDAARLLVDLVLSVRRAGVAPLQWSDTAEVSAYLDGLCKPARSVGLAVVADPVDEFIDRVVDKLPSYVRAEALQMTTEQWHWQWHAALAKELIRQGTRAGLPGPRAVAALIAAVRQLLFAADAFARIDYIGYARKTHMLACVANKVEQQEQSSRPVVPAQRKDKARELPRDEPGGLSDGHARPRLQPPHSAAG